MNQPDGTVQVTTLSGSQYVADAVVGADGVRSNLRKAIVDDDLVPSKYVAYRGTVPIEVVAADVTSSPAVLCWLGPNMHLIQYPLRDGRLYNNVAVFKSDAYSPDSDDWGTPEELDARFAACCETVQNAGKYLSRDIRWPMYDREPAEKWVDGKVALIGDAAHAMLQYLAQGGAQSLDDSIAMAEALLDDGRRRAGVQARSRPAASRTPATSSAWRAWQASCSTSRASAGTCATSPSRTTIRSDYSNLDWMFMPLAKAPEARSYPV